MAALGGGVRVVVEVDVGLCRGGVSDLAGLLALIPQGPWVRGDLVVAGLMGYDGHLLKSPLPQAWRFVPRWLMARVLLQVCVWRGSRGVG